MSREPWELYPSIWPTKPAFFAYLRGQLRLTWSRYPAKLKWKQSKLVSPPKGYKGKAKKLGQCHYCGEWWPASALEVDHVEFAGQCNSWETASQFLYKLLDCNDNWVLADKTCHRIKSYAEREGITFEQAREQKLIIEMMKDKKAVLALALKSGYTEQDVSNDVKRRAVLKEILDKEKK